jgi:hypothetical protein
MARPASGRQRTGHSLWRGAAQPDPAAVLGNRYMHLILDADAALDLALRITGTVIHQRRTAVA